MPSEYIKDKAREISYVFIRVAFYIKRPELQAKFEKLAFELLDNAARINSDTANSSAATTLSVISALDAMVRLAHSIYEIEPVNATILVRELNALETAVKQLGKPEEKLPDLESLFSHMPVPVMNKVLSNSAMTDDTDLAAYRSPLNGNVSLEELSAPSAEAKINRENQSANIAVRQSAVLEKIKSGNGAGVRLKDVLAAFPNVSERTIRYDLQRLCDDRAIERFGPGGPATYYRALENKV